MSFHLPPGSRAWIVFRLPDGRISGPHEISNPLDNPFTWRGTSDDFGPNPELEKAMGLEPETPALGWENKP